MEEFDELDPPEPQTARQRALANLDAIREQRRQGVAATRIAVDLLGVTSGRLSQLRKTLPELAAALDTVPDYADVERPPERVLDTGKPLGHADTLAWIEERVAQGMGPEAIGVLLGLDGAGEFESKCREKPEVMRAVKTGKARREALAAENLNRIMTNPNHRDHAKVSQYMARCSGPHWAPVLSSKEAPKQTAVDEEAVLSPAEIMARLAGPG